MVGVCSLVDCGIRYYLGLRKYVEVVFCGGCRALECEQERVQGCKNVRLLGPVWAKERPFWGQHLSGKGGLGVSFGPLALVKRSMKSMAYEAQKYCLQAAACFATISG